MALVSILFVIPAFLQKQEDTSLYPSPTEHIAPTLLIGKETNIDLFEQNKSGFAGEVRIKEVNGKVSVTVWSNNDIPEELEDSLIPASLHKGSCKALGTVEYQLNDLVDASSETIFDMSEAEFTALFPLALSIKKSPEEPNKTLACADITKASFNTYD